jgi:hypothetical protein
MKDCNIIRKGPRLLNLRTRESWEWTSASRLGSMPQVENDCQFRIAGWVTSAQSEGLQEISRWSKSAETTGKVVIMTRTLKGCQTSQSDTSRQAEEG